jgi:hypothetical protein
VTSSGGDAALSQKLSPLTVDQCKGVATDVARGTAVASVRSPGVTVLGMTHVRAAVAVTGHDALLVGACGTSTRPPGASAWSTAASCACARASSSASTSTAAPTSSRRGHQIKLELLGRDTPTYRAANGAFSVTVKQLRVALPTRERPAKRAP